MRITYHCWTESMILSLVDLQEGQLFPQYYYVSNNSNLVNKKALLQWFLLIEQEANLQLIVVEPIL